MATTKKSAAKPKNKEMSAKFPMTISRPVWEAWQKQRKKNDAREICAATGLSRPIVDRALNYGHINNETLEESISSYFLDRKDSTESEASKRLLEKS